MEINRESVNEWLTETRRSRDWLADQCEVGVAAVGHWLNKRSQPRPIPADKIMIIQKLMEEDASASQTKPAHSIVLEFDDEDYELIEGAALKAHITVRDWAKETLNSIANEDIEELARRIKSSLIKEEEPSAFEKQLKKVIGGDVSTPPDDEQDEQVEETA